MIESERSKGSADNCSVRECIGSEEEHGVVRSISSAVFVYKGHESSKRPGEQLIFWHRTNLESHKLRVIGFWFADVDEWQCLIYT